MSSSSAQHLSPPFGSVSFSQAACEIVQQGRPIVEMEMDDIFAGIKKHLDDGVDCITVHCGVTRRTLEIMDREGRVMDVVSRGGSFTCAWMGAQQPGEPAVRAVRPSA